MEGRSEGGREAGGKRRKKEKGRKEGIGGWSSVPSAGVTLNRPFTSLSLLPLSVKER